MEAEYHFRESCLIYIVYVLQLTIDPLAKLVMVFMIQTRSKPNLEKEMSEFVLAGIAAHSASYLVQLYK